MSFDDAIRLTELLLGFAFLQQSLEHLRGPRDEQLLFAPRVLLSLLLMAGFGPAYVSLALVVHSILILHRFHGPYNGGSDRMGVLILCSLTLNYFVPQQWREVAFGYIALQLILSYFVAGWVKVVNPDWRSGRALADVFLFSAYPVSEGLRGLAARPRLLFVASWAVMLFELLFPFALQSQPALMVALGIGAVFHLANAFLFGLNRFFWAWIAAYPAILWLQTRILL